MKKSKRIIVLTAVLAIICLATFILSKYEEEKEQISNSDAIILEIPSDSVQSLSWDSEDNSLAFHKEDDGWIYDEDDCFPVDDDKINDILSNFESFGVTFIIEDVTDYNQYGLDVPECTIHIATEDKNYDIKLGAYSQMDEQRYVDIGDGSVYLVSEDPINYVDCTLADMILHDDTPSFETVADIQFKGLENYTIVRDEESSNTYNTDDIYFITQDQNTVPLDTSTVESYLSTITSLVLSDYVTYNATEDELKTYGLDEPELSVTINHSYTDDEDNVIDGTFILHISRNPEELQAAKETEAAGETADTVSKYVRIGDSQIVYELSDTNYATLAAASYNDLRHSEVIWADFDIVTKIDITLEDETHSLTYKESESESDDSDGAWYYGDEEISITGLQTNLESLSAYEFTNISPDGKEEISLTVYLENENFSRVKIQLFRHDGDYCIAVVDNTPVSFITRSSVIDLIESVQSILLN